MLVVTGQEWVEGARRAPATPGLATSPKVLGVGQVTLVKKDKEAGMSCPTLVRCRAEDRALEDLADITGEAIMDDHGAS